MLELTESGEAALMLNHKSCDFIVFDIGIMDGFQFAEILRCRSQTAGGWISAIARSAYTRGQNKTRDFRSWGQALGHQGTAQCHGKFRPFVLTIWTKKNIHCALTQWMF